MPDEPVKLLNTDRKILRISISTGEKTPIIVESEPTPQPPAPHTTPLVYEPKFAKIVEFL